MSIQSAWHQNGGGFYLLGLLIHSSMFGRTVCSFRKPSYLSLFWRSDPFLWRHITWRGGRDGDKAHSQSHSSQVISLELVSAQLTLILSSLLSFIQGPEGYLSNTMLVEKRSLTNMYSRFQLSSCCLCVSRPSYFPPQPWSQSLPFQLNNWFSIISNLILL